MILRTMKYSLYEIDAISGSPKAIVGEIKEGLRLKYNAAIKKLLVSKGPGRSTVLPHKEEGMIVCRIIFAAKRGFAIDHSSIKHVLS